MALNYSQLNWNHYFNLLGLSDEFVAEKVGVSRQAIWYLRTGKKKLANSTCRKVAVLIGEYLQAQAEYNRKEAEKARLSKIGVDIYLENMERNESNE